MSISHILESFATTSEEGREFSMSELNLEEEKLAAFERGYQAGWDDSTKAQADSRNRVTSDFEKNLQAMSFTYHEAHQHLAKSLRPILAQIVETILPAMARTSLVPEITAQLETLTAHAGQQDIEIVAAPGNAEFLKKVFPEDPGFPVRLNFDPAIGEGQVFLRWDEQERQIDYDNVLRGIEAAIAAFFHEAEQMSEKEADHAG